MSEPPVVNVPPPLPAPRPSPMHIVLGFAVGALPWIPAFRGNKNDDLLLWLVVVPLISPLVGLLLAFIRPTRRFGLGVLLATGVGWLVLGAMCSGLLR